MKQPRLWLMARCTALLLLAISLCPAAAESQLSRAERKDRLQSLSDTYRQFLLDVEPIIDAKERDAFLTLESDPQRDAFIENFWQRHAPEGLTGDAFRSRYYALIETAAEKYRRGTDRYRIYVVNGAPGQVIDPNCQHYLVPMELWRYPYVKSLGHDATLLFYIPRSGTDYVLWNPIGKETYPDLLTHEGLAVGVECVFVVCLVTLPNGLVVRDPPKIESDCAYAEVLHRTIDSIATSGPNQLKALTPPVVPQEPVKLLLKSMVVPTKGAAKLDAEWSVAFTRKDGNRIDTQLTVLLPRAQLTRKEIAGSSAYGIDVTGEVLRNDALFERYRYRFDLPGDSTADRLPLVIDRFLPIGPCKLRLKVVDANSVAEAILEKEVIVPEGGAAVAGAAPKPDADQSELRIVPLQGEILAGLQHIETIVSGDDIKAVEFYLDGRKIMTKRQPPYTLDLDFGEVPQVRRVRAIALDAKGQPVAGDELVLNTGTDPFRVRIVSPRVALRVKGRTRVEIAVNVPDGKKLDNLQLYLNETRVATLYDPPFVQTIDVPATQGVGYLRAVATLADDAAPPAEDLVMINTPQYMEELNVHLVELPTTVIVNGRPTDALSESAFKVFDEGQPVKLAKFEQVKNLPLSIGMAVDTSGSMQPRIAEAQKAGALFFKNVLKTGDKAFLVSFDIQPQVVQKWSSELTEMTSGLAKLRAEESTALYDAIVYSLYNFLGVKGQRALVLITDGDDTSSKFTFDQALEYARRSAVPIYAIGLGIRAASVDVKYKLGKLAGETGGNVYYIDRAEELGKIYNDIQDELRSQYILGFYPPADVKPGGKWREVSVVVSEGRAKTVRGYYP